MNGLTQGPLPTPGFLPPSDPNPSQVGDGRVGGRGRVTPLPLGGNGGRGRVTRLPLGANAGGGRGRVTRLPRVATAAQLREGERGHAPAPGFLPPSRPTLPQVGDGRSGFSQSAPFAEFGGIRAKQRMDQTNDQLMLMRRAAEVQLAQSSVQHKLRLIDVCNSPNFKCNM